MHICLLLLAVVSVAALDNYDYIEETEAPFVVTCDGKAFNEQPYTWYIDGNNCFASRKGCEPYDATKIFASYRECANATIANSPNRRYTQVSWCSNEIFHTEEVFGVKKEKVPLLLKDCSSAAILCPDEFNSCNPNTGTPMTAVCCKPYWGGGFYVQMQVNKDQFV